MVRLKGRKEGKRKEMTRLGTNRANITQTPNINCNRQTMHSFIVTSYMYSTSWSFRIVSIFRAENVIFSSSISNQPGLYGECSYTYTRHDKSPQVPLHRQPNHLCNDVQIIHKQHTKYYSPINSIYNARYYHAHLYNMGPTILSLVERSSLSQR